uniref:Ribulose bisphosphate carboxylase small subunit, chloroplastic 1/4 n=1 Tax=Fritillaria agrestis TaxID=64177 RepID=RBS1_FRIAG|nr:RecName: Full=Ribulose bisphosphate carboxylase small subunit, chloroplastic 1/4; Short=RuBisCO small subunit 1/4; Flags: Precursor [Fritillaria agrestis]AAB84179.1 ribulose 1,5 bisphosphate carboxylase, small subunit type I [Fritillaria agrestis]AAB86853.1 ribulose 1,5 bisphosphate carboxylase small subunit type IV [Fritillaria agrestis]
MAASSTMLSSVATAACAAPAQASMVAPFVGLKSTSAFPVTQKPATGLSTLPSNGGRVQCMKVWPIVGLKKFETLSYLPTLSVESLLKQIEYLIRNGWVPCLEFSLEGFVSRDNNKSPGYYDGRYWTMWKLPMFGCTDAAQVVKEAAECKKEYPAAFIRVIGFDNVRQVQCVSFIVERPE